MTEPRFPGYDVLDKRHTPSWNEQTRRVIDARLALPRSPRFLTESEWATLSAIGARLVPQPADRPPVPVAALVDDRLVRDSSDGYRDAKMPRLREAWRQGLAAIDEAAERGYGARFAELGTAIQDELLRACEAGRLSNPAWGDMPPSLFFKKRLLHDVLHAYYGHPTAWSEIGFGGPASPRGYVRMGADRRDPWEAAEVKDGDVAAARRANARIG